ncbi:MAG: ESPR-type extended signal peptide-containing protein [Allisonella histaminiformans]|uniref:ESPR-type extended signal peptide-containing protein n=1 Tax=Allisonella histaminiformans TaxID=209880 RepID=UPI002A83DC8D|nr:ESPR-type extended signal peptide-containing protein [Allisonella histaminiformans]MDY3956994.1 ESPR-type extended signal peptide-containing protein [Allisonella histaminiformans]
MNNIHKIVWSKVRNGYVVVSELAKNHSRKGSRGMTGSNALRAGFLSAGVSAALLFGGVQLAGAAGTVEAGTASGTNALAVGSTSKANTEDSVAIGSGAIANGSAGSVAIGSNSYVGRAAGADNGPRWSTSQAIGGRWYTWTAAKNATKGTDGTWTTTVDTASTVWQSNLGAVSIGTDGLTGTTYTRQLTGLAAGTQDTDAVNVAQWKNTMLATIGDAREDSTNTRYGSDGVARNVTRLVDEYLTLTGAADDGTTLTKDQLTTDANIGTVVGDNKITFRLAKDLKGLDSVTAGNTKMESSGLTITNTDSKKTITLDGTNGRATIGGVTVGYVNDGDLETNAHGSVSGGTFVYNLSNTTWDPSTYVSGRAATEDQLHMLGTAVTSDINNIQAVLGDGSFGLTADDHASTSTNLGSTIAVKGDGTNITTKVDGGALQITLNKDIDLGMGGSVIAGNTTINSGGVTTNQVSVGGITLTENGIDGGQKQMTNIASGGDTDTNGANIGDVKKLATTVTGGTNTTVTPSTNSNGGTTYQVDLKDTVTLGSDTTKQVVLDGTSGILKAGTNMTLDGVHSHAYIGGVNVGHTQAGTLTYRDEAGKVATDKTVAMGNYVYSLSNTEWDGTHYVSGRAATEDQLYYVGQSVKNLADQYQSDFNSISAALGGGTFGLSSDNGDEVTTNLGSTVAVKGDGNITTAVQGGDLHVKLSDDINLGTNGSVTAGNTTINSSGVNTNEVQVGNITITENGIDGGRKQITNIASGLSGQGYDTSVTGQGNWNNAASIGDVYTIASNAASGSKLQSGKNITVTAENKINLNDDITLGTDSSQQVKVDGTNGQVVIGSGNTAVILGQQSNISGDNNPAEGNYLTGLNNTKWDVSTIQSGRAATEDQLKAVDDKITGGRKFTGDDGLELTVGLGQNLSLTGGAQADNLSDGNIGVVKNGDNGLSVKLSKNLTGLNSVITGDTTIDNKGLTIRTSDSDRTISIADGNVNMGNNIVSGVADGQVAQESTDAINGGQLWQRDQAINSLGGAVNKLGSRINRVGAGAAALAALHPLDFDPDEKWDFAAGYGNYKDVSAMAVGAYYRPNEDTMFSIGGSFGGGENMVNAGISFKFGQGNHVSTSRVAMAKEIKDLRKEIESLRSALADVAAGNRLDPTKTKLFPDVASNHWAYNEIAQLHGNGIIEGYPDGTFKGDRMMTRYEFAMMVYREMQRGAQLSERIINEFEPELERIRVDIVAKDNHGNPTIERVRVIKGRK